MDIDAALRRTILILIFLGTFAGCATSSLFNPYPSQAIQYKNAISFGDYEVDQSRSVLNELEQKSDNADFILYMMESGRINQLNGNYLSSKSDFERVIDAFEQQDLQATIRLHEVAAQSTSLISNDNAIPYSGAGYERIFTHHHQALNYLLLGDLDGAAVEFRKVALEQRVLLEQHESEIADAYQEAEKNEIDIDSLSYEFSGMDRVAGSVKTSFQNGYTFYLSAAFWEATGDYNAALIDYKKAYEINENNHYLKQDIARISKKMGASTKSNDLNDMGVGQGAVVVLFEEGFVPEKEEITIPIPTFDGGLINLAFPYYETQGWRVSPKLRVTDSNFEELGYSQEVVNVGVLAVKNLKEQIPKLLVRQALRGMAKYRIQKKATNQAGIAGQFLANVYNIISESADRRSWLTLPRTAQVIRLNLDEGVQEVSLSTPNRETKVTLDVKKNKTQFLRVYSANNRIMTQVIAL